MMSVPDNINASFDTTRNEFEDEVMEHLMVFEYLTFVDSAIEKSGLNPEEITSVVLVGGSTRIPHIKQRF